MMVKILLNFLELFLLPICSYSYLSETFCIYFFLLFIFLIRAQIVFFENECNFYMVMAKNMIYFYKSIII